MPLTLARLLVGAIAAYAAIGLVIAVPFAARGAARIDPAAQGAPLGFRLLIVPGTIAFWPYLLVRWLCSGRR